MTVRPTRDPAVFQDADGNAHRKPDGWEAVPPGDPGLTRRIKAAGVFWSVEEPVRNKVFSRGLLAPADRVARIRQELEVERARPEYARKQAAAVVRREREQTEYVEDFGASVREFLAFGRAFEDLERRLAALVTEHATPVGSGTVARTERIPVEERARAAVIAWMRHQTTRYDNMSIERVKGRRREVRRELAAESRQVLDSHRGRRPHPTACPLCQAVASAEAPEPAIGRAGPVSPAAPTPTPTAPPPKRSAADLPARASTPAPPAPRGSWTRG